MDLFVESLQEENQELAAEVVRLTAEVVRLTAEVVRLGTLAGRAKADLAAIMDFLICQENSEDFRCSALFDDARFSSRDHAVRYIRAAAGLDAAPAGSGEGGDA